MHAKWESVLICSGSLVNDLAHFIMSNQLLEYLLFVLESMSAQPSFVSNQASHSLRMLSRDQ